MSYSKVVLNGIDFLIMTIYLASIIFLNFEYLTPNRSNQILKIVGSPIFNEILSLFNTKHST